MELSSVPIDFGENGFAWLRGALSADQCAALKFTLLDFAVAAGRGGVRQIHQKSETIQELALQGELAILAQNLLQEPIHLVRSIFFDKTPQQNWLVSWHQDLTVTAAETFSAEGWGPWSRKENIIHVQPPLEVLQSMLTMRLHLDRATKQNGCLKVIPRSHLGGIVRSELSAKEVNAVFCEAEVGDILLMSPLLWHASSKAIEASSRQVLHFEYSNHRCATDLAWPALEIA
ncbi:MULTISPECIES: phytanoyl-CoA dioxygenase family protein [Deefgea]|uniref:phytanoyl-CoA dioxygenase family protein n=1 Tax=Deefgea TaxID=400947 RepID=UPI001944CE13|nr:MULTISPECIES: phytanoyl-CoA dioxygenase family protein [Deefgea]MBM9889012.1 phytanoyl-CoA dioxygenase family protein [Deefgea sp. CFH1-16]